MLRVAFIVTSLLLLIPPDAVGLERTTARLADRPGSETWAAGSSCSLSYFNACTGWIWIWDDWDFTDVIGMVIDPECGDGSYQTLVSTTLYAWTGAPSYGYGDTGTIFLAHVDDDGCPIDILAAQPFLPASGPNVTLWNLPLTGPTAVLFENPAAPGSGSGVSTWGTDRPAAGPTGPQACGYCYPSDRTTHSFYYGPASSPLCPPQPLNDGVCDAEWLLWSAQLSSPVSVAASSWGAVKALYR